PEDLQHLLPQIGARCARKVRNGKVSAAHLLKTTRRGGSTPRGRLLFPLSVSPKICSICCRK
ncbi:hypothetical protein, partial [Agathobaculum sp.]|uniref:hypothetical protein n=1 Tax=Agathobaculum sp. TaxID=2048138 RepID=UPI0039A25540